MKDYYQATKGEIENLAQKYNPFELSQGKIKGKGSLKLRKIENRLKAISYLAEHGNYEKSDLKLAYHVIEDKANSRYWKSLIRNNERGLNQKLIDNTKNTLSKYLNKYISQNTSYKESDSKSITSEKNQNDNIEKIVSHEKSKGLISRMAGLTKKKLIAGMAISSILIGSFWLSYHLSKKYENYNSKQIRLEQEINEFNGRKPNIILTDLSEDEIDGIYEKYKKTKQEGKAPIIDLRGEKPIMPECYADEIKQAKAEPRQIRDIAWKKKPSISREEHNKGIFKKGYCYNKDIYEFSADELKEKSRLEKRWEPMAIRARKNLNKTRVGITKIVTGPFKAVYNLCKGNGKQAARDVISIPAGAIEAVSGGIGSTNSVVENLVRPPAYGLTRSDKVDGLIEDFMDASYGGAFYNELHKDFVRLPSWNKQGGFIQTIKEYPVKTGISVVEDALLIKWLRKKDGKEEGIKAKEPGRKGGEGTQPGGRGGGAGR